MLVFDINFAILSMKSRASVCINQNITSFYLIIFASHSLYWHLKKMHIQIIQLKFEIIKKKKSGLFNTRRYFPTSVAKTCVKKYIVIYEHVFTVTNSHRMNQNRRRCLDTFFYFSKHEF